MTETDRLDRLVQRLDRLRTLDPDLQAFGALSHEYRLLPPLSELEIAGFEQEHGVVLPAEYRLFLARVGNGGAGPYYGLTPLAAWRPDLLLVERYVEFDGDRPVMVDGKIVEVEIGPRPWLDRLADPARPFLLEGPWPQRDSDVLPAQDAHPFDGCTFLCEMGDGYRCFLVITGSRAGEVWEDHTHGVAFEAVRPTGLTFLAWYEQWLDGEIAPDNEQVTA